jgi:hypothetical protein
MKAKCASFRTERSESCRASPSCEHPSGGEHSVERPKRSKVVQSRKESYQRSLYRFFDAYGSFTVGLTFLSLLRRKFRSTWAVGALQCDLNFVIVCDENSPHRDDYRCTGLSNLGVENLPHDHVEFCLRAMGLALSVPGDSGFPPMTYSMTLRWIFGCRSVIRFTRVNVSTRISSIFRNRVCLRQSL